MARNHFETCGEATSETRRSANGTLTYRSPPDDITRSRVAENEALLEICTEAPGYSEGSFRRAQWRSALPSPQAPSMMTPMPD